MSADHLPMIEGGDFETIYRLWHRILKTAPLVAGNYWQALDVSKQPMRVTREIRDAIMRWDMPESAVVAQSQISPNMPWAEDHFQERVSGQPLNPGNEYMNWPYFKGNVEQHQTQDGKQFSHTYMERFWPKHAHGGLSSLDCTEYCGGNHGVRFYYGDLQDVIDQLYHDPLTRQAYLPVFFPEDTGAVHGERVPCTLGYQFMIRDDGRGLRLHINYFIRSCDLLRHFRDDVYLAVRLAQWVRNKLLPGCKCQMGDLTMFMGSLHVFKGDEEKMRRDEEVWERDPLAKGM
jgi:hypothetical protein